MIVNTNNLNLSANSSDIDIATIYSMNFGDFGTEDYSRDITDNLKIISDDYNQEISDFYTDKWASTDTKLNIGEYQINSNIFSMPGKLNSNLNNLYETNNNNYLINDNGNLKSEKLSDGTSKVWYENSVLKYEYLKDGAYKSYDQNGNLESEKLSDGVTKYYNEKGVLKQEYLQDGTEKKWYDNGNLENYARIISGDQMGI